MPVSESQKQGVSALGCRFSEKAEYVPIKKRRFLFRSPSPPAEETKATENVSNNSAVPKSTTSEINASPMDNNVNIDVTNMNKSDGKFGEEEDFSGISILAAAACSTCLGTEFGKTIEESSVLHRPCEVSTSVKPTSLSKGLLKEELLSSSEMSTGETLSCISTEPVAELVSISTAVNLPSKVVTDEKYIKDEEMVGDERPSSHDVKFQWDLNVVMDDAWDEPLDDTSARNVCHTPDVVKSNRDSHDQQATVSAEQCTLVRRVDQKPSSNQALGGKKGNQDRKASKDVDQSDHLGEKSVISRTCSNLNVVKCVIDESKSTNNLAAAAASSDHATKPSTSCSLNEIDNVAVKSLNLIREKRGYDQRDMTSDSRMVVPFTEVGNLSSVSASDVACDTILAGTRVGFRASSKLDTLKDVTQNTTISKEIQSSVSDGKILPHSSMSTEASNSTRTKYSSKYNNDVPSGVRDDYDYQYEDGELRESTELAWEEYDDVDREHVDYGSDDNGTCPSYPSDYHNSELGQVEGRMYGREDIDVCKQADIAVEDDCGNDKDKKLNSRNLSVEKMEVMAGTEQGEKSKSSLDMASGTADDDGKKDRLSNVDGLIDSKGTGAREEPKAFRRALQSRIEGPIFHDVASRDDRPFRSGNRFQSGSTRSFERGRYPYHNQGRGRQGGNWDSPSYYQRDYKRHYSPFSCRRSKLDDDSVMEKDEAGCDGNRDGLSYSCQHPISRTGPDEESCPGSQSRYRPDRSAGFARGRPFRYGSLGETVGGRGRGRGRFNGPSPVECFQSSLKYRRPLSRRERSFSPFAGRGQTNINHSRGKSPSRSRSRSPVVWDSPRERSGSGRGCRTFVRHRSRSPNFRAEVRIQRLRSPNQQPGFGDGHAGGLRSITRTHNSPPHNRWNSGRRDDMGNFREFGYKQRTTPLERSSGRFRSREDRDSVISSPRNMKPDGYCRFSDRIADDGDGTGRVMRFADNYEERRKPNNFVRPARRSYEDGMASRLHQEMDDDFSNTNNIRNRDGPRFRGRGGFRGIDNRNGDMRRSFRGEQQSFAYDRDRKFNSNSNEFTADRMGSSHNHKSEDQFHSNHTGRYDDIGRTNPGHRYRNYEDRRNRYGENTFTGRTDNEGTEDRLNQNADKKFQDAQDIIGSGPRVSEGQPGIVTTSLKEISGVVVSEREENLHNNSRSIGEQNSENEPNVGFIPS